MNHLKSIIGVYHMRNQIEQAWKSIGGKINAGTRVGLEPYAIPVDATYWRRDHAEFFNGIAELVERAGGSCFPLSTEQTTRELCASRNAVSREYSQLSETLKTGTRDTSIDYTEESLRMADLLERSLLIKHDVYQPWLTSLTEEIELAQTNQVEHVVVGRMHVPNFLAHFPRATLEFVAVRS